MLAATFLLVNTMLLSSVLCSEHGLSKVCTVRPNLCVDTNFDYASSIATAEPLTMQKRISMYGSILYDRACQLSMSPHASEDPAAVHSNDASVPPSATSPRSAEGQFGFFNMSSLLTDALASTKKEAAVDLEAKSEHDAESSSNTTVDTMKRLSRSFSELIVGIYKGKSSSESPLHRVSNETSAVPASPALECNFCPSTRHRVIRFADEELRTLRLASAETFDLMEAEQKSSNGSAPLSPMSRVRRRDPRVLSKRQLSRSDPIVVAICDFVGNSIFRDSVEAIVVGHWTRERAEWMFDHAIGNIRYSIGDAYDGFLKQRYTLTDLHVLLRMKSLHYFLPWHFMFHVRNYLGARGVANVPETLPRDYKCVSVAIPLWTAARDLYRAELNGMYLRSALRTRHSQAPHSNGIMHTVQIAHLEELFRKEGLYQFLMHGLSREEDMQAFASLAPTSFRELVDRTRQVLAKHSTWPDDILRNALAVIMGRADDYVLRVLSMNTIGPALRKRVRDINESLSQRHIMNLKEAVPDLALVLNATFPNLMDIGKYKRIIADLLDREWGDEDAETYDAVCTAIAGMEGQVAFYNRIQKTPSEAFNGELRNFVVGFVVDLLVAF